MYATTNYGFETTDLLENEVDQIWRNINLRKSSDLKSLDSIELPIVSFDVSKDGIILLGFKENKIGIAYVNVPDITQVSYASADNSILLLLMTK